MTGRPHVLLAFKHCEFGGGAEKNLIEVAEHMAKRYRVSFLISGGHVDPRMTAVGPVHYFPSRGRSWLMPLDLLFLPLLVRRAGVNLIHAHHRYPAFVASLTRWLHRARLLTTVHNRFPDKSRFSRWGEHAIAVSDMVREWLVTECALPASRITTIYNGIEAPARIDVDARVALRSALGISGGSLVLCSVGRLTRQKNYPLLLRALGQLGASGWRLLIVGEGEDRALLEAQVSSAGLADRVQFLGRRRDVTDIMQASDIYVMSSAWEGFPYVIVEALACGLPIVSTDVGGVAAGVRHEETGLLVPPDDAPALARSIGRLATDAQLRRRMGEQGVRLFQERFRREAMFRETEKVYEAVLHCA